MLDPDATLALAESVADAAQRLGIATALIGGAALAVHRYTRATQDIDLAVVIDPMSQLRALGQALDAAGLQTRLRLPDDEDPLGGVLVVWIATDDADEPCDTVEVVNFHNPACPRHHPARDAIARAQMLDGGPLRCVVLADLIALKLDAGGMSDMADILQLLVRNPEADIKLIRAIAGPYDSQRLLEPLILQAQGAWAATGSEKRR